MESGRINRLAVDTELRANSHRSSFDIACSKVQKCFRARYLQEEISRLQTR